MTNLLWTGFVFGFLGSFHGVGMCGPIALALPASQSGIGFVTGRLAYNSGRVITYSALGVLFGIFGKGLQIAGLQQIISIVSGLLILLFLFLPSQTSSKISAFLKVGKAVHYLKQQLGRLLRRGSSMSLLFIGILNGLLPCGFVYLALAATISAKDVFDSILYMTLFGLGTIPVMLLLSFSGKMITLKYRGMINKAIPYAACLLAILFILRGLSLGIPYVSPDLSQKDQKTYHCH
jgi:uncharacterized protein